MRKGDKYRTGAKKKTDTKKLPQCRKKWKHFLGDSVIRLEDKQMLHFLPLTLSIYGG